MKTDFVMGYPIQTVFLQGPTAFDAPQQPAGRARNRRASGGRERKRGARKGKAENAQANDERCETKERGATGERKPRGESWRESEREGSGNEQANDGRVAEGDPRQGEVSE